MIPERRDGHRPPGRQCKLGIQADDIRVKGIGGSRDIADAEFETLPELWRSQLADLRCRLGESARQYENENRREQPFLRDNIHSIQGCQRARQNLAVVPAGIGFVRLSVLATRVLVETVVHALRLVGLRLVED